MDPLFTFILGKIICCGVVAGNIVHICVSHTSSLTDKQPLNTWKICYFSIFHSFSFWFISFISSSFCESTQLSSFHWIQPTISRKISLEISPFFNFWFFKPFFLEDKDATNQHRSWLVSNNANSLNKALIFKTRLISKISQKHQASCKSLVSVETSSANVWIRADWRRFLPNFGKSWFLSYSQTRILC